MTANTTGSAPGTDEVARANRMTERAGLVLPGNLQIRAHKSRMMISAS